MTQKQSDQYESLAKNALKTLEMSYKEDGELEDLLHKLETAIVFPATQTEAEILRLAQATAKEIRNHGDVSLIMQLLEQLHSEFVFSILD